MEKFIDDANFPLPGSLFFMDVDESLNDDVKLSLNGLPVLHDKNHGFENLNFEPEAQIIWFFLYK